MGRVSINMSRRWRWGRSAPVPGRSNARTHDGLRSSSDLCTFHLAVAEDGHTPLADGARAVPSPQPRKLSGLIDSQADLPCSRAADGDRPRSGNASVFIPLTMIPRTELAVGNATGRADLSRWNQMKVDGAAKAR